VKRTESTLQLENYGSPTAMTRCRNYVYDNDVTRSRKHPQRGT